MLIDDYHGSWIGAGLIQPPLPAPFSGLPCPSFPDSQVPSPLTLPSALLIPPQEVAGRPILPQSCVLHNYSCLTTGLPARRIHFWLYPLEVIHLSCQLLQCDCIFGGRVPILCWFISEGRTSALEIPSLSEWLGETFDSNLAWNICEAKATFLHS